MATPSLVVHNPSAKSSYASTGTSNVFGTKVNVEKKIFTNLTEKQTESIEYFFQGGQQQANRCFFGSDDYDTNSGFFTGNGSLKLHRPEDEEGEESLTGTKTGESEHGASGGNDGVKSWASRLAHLHAGVGNKGHHEGEAHDHHHGSGHGHDHDHLKEPSIITALSAGIINYVLMFGFCCAYGLIMFNDPGNHRHCALGMRMALGCAMMMGFLLASFSRIPIAIGGPDMNAVIFVGNFVKIISKELVKHLKLGDCKSCGSDGGLGKYFCTGEHYALHTSACDEYHSQLRATVLFSVTISSAIVAGVFGLLGVLKFTVYVSYVPTSIVDAFLSCMGYKVFKYGIKICKYDPSKFIPAALIGVPAYFIKAMHIGNPLITLPTFIVLPFIFAYFQMWVKDESTTEARGNNILFTEVDHEDFWTIWTDGVLNFDKINFKAWWETKYEIVTMVVVLVLDCLVTALRTTEAKMPIKVKKNYESMMYGMGNALSACVGGVPGYMQLKFNVINFGIMSNTQDRRSGIVFVVLCAITFFTSGYGFNYVPRVFVGTLLFFGGSGFVAEHLWGSKDYLSYAEWAQVFVILAIFIIFDDIVYAVGIGCMLCGFTFITKYANIPCIAGVPLRGGDVHSHEQYAPMVLTSLMHISNSWLLVIRLKGFVFFASVQSVTQSIRNMMLMENQEDTPIYRRVKFVLLDCQLLDGLDSSAEKDLQMITRDASWHGIRILWASLEPDISEAMQARGTINDTQNVFKDTDDAILYIEGLCLGYRKKQQDHWEQLHPAFELFRQLSILRETFEPWANVLRLDADRFGCPWDFVGRTKIRKCRTLLWGPNEQNRELFLVHTGAVGIFRHIPNHKGMGEFGKPIAVYRHGWFLNREFLLRSPTKYYAVALEDGEVIYWSKHEWWRMHREVPFMANAILEAAMKQASCDMERVATVLQSCAMTATADDEAQAESLKSRYQKKDAMWQMKGKEGDLPEDLEARIEGMLNAQSLEQFRLYDPIPEGEDGYLPEMPPPIRRDLEGAFKTYKETAPDGTEQIPWKKVPEALMYAGVFNCLLSAGGKDVGEAEFVQVGHEAIFYRLSDFQIAKVYNVFKEFVSRTGGEIPRNDLHECLTTSFLPRICEQEINGIAEIWDTDASDSVDAGEFVGVVSRLVRRHEIDWNLLRGCRELLRKPSKMSIGATDTLNVNKLLYKDKFKGTPRIPGLTEADCKEMLWSNACYSKLLSSEQQGQLLDFAGLVGAVVFGIPRPMGKLPPPPAKETAHVHASYSRFRSLVEHSDETHNAHLLRFKHDIEVAEGQCDEWIGSGEWMARRGSALTGEAYDNASTTVMGASEAWASEDLPDSIGARRRKLGRGLSSNDIKPKEDVPAKANEVVPMVSKQSENLFVPEFDIAEAKAKPKKKKLMKKKKGNIEKDADESEKQSLLATVAEDMPSALDVQGLRALFSQDPLQDNSSLSLEGSPLLATQEFPSPDAAHRQSDSSELKDSRLKQRSSDGGASASRGVVAFHPSAFDEKPSKVVAPRLWDRGDPTGSMVAEGPTLSEMVGRAYNPKAPKNEAVFAEARRKVQGRLPEIIKEIKRHGAEVALKECCMDRKTSRVTDFVIDLRSTGSSTAAPKRYLKTRLERVDFSLERKMSDLRQHNDFSLEECVPNTPEVKIFLLLEEPTSSKAAAMWAGIIGTVIILSVASMFVKSLMHPYNATIDEEEKVYWRVAEATFTIIFLTELMIRFAVADALQNQTHLEFLLKPLNICDALSCMPFIMEILVSSRGRTGSSENLSFLRVARLLRLTRVLRIARLGGKDSAGVQIFGPVSVILTIIYGIYLKEATG